MSASSRWFLVERDFQSAAHHFGMAHAILGSGQTETADELERYMARGAFMQAVIAGHTSLEAGILRALKTIGEAPPVDVGNWPEAAVEAAGAAPLGRHPPTLSGEALRRAWRRARDRGQRPPILSGESLEAARETRMARNLAVREHDSFSMDRAGKTARAAKHLASCLANELARFIEVVDPALNKGAGAPSMSNR